MRLDVRQATTMDDANREFRKIKKSINDLNIYMGYGSPENLIVAAPGSLYLNLDGGTSTTLYVKETGEGVSSGWIAK